MQSRRLLVAACLVLAGCSRPCRIEEHVYDPGLGAWHRYSRMDIDPDGLCRWRIDPPSDWTAPALQGELLLTEEETANLRALDRSGGFDVAGGVPSYRIDMDNHRQRVPPAIRAVVARVRERQR